MRRQLTDLREKMELHGIDIYLIPDTDPHGSEYVHDHFKGREYVSGFTGSAGTLVVTRDWAGLWTDGRYFIQAAQQLEESGITLMKLGEPEVPEPEEYLVHYAKGSRAEDADHKPVLGFDGRLVSLEMGRKLEKFFTPVHNADLVDLIWENRPQIIPSEIYKLYREVTGEQAASKLKRLRCAMGEADNILLTGLEEIAWLYNLRGADVAHTPVFFSFALISKTEDTLYVMDEKFLKYCSQEGNEHPSCCKRYDELYEDLTGLEDCRLLLDEKAVSYAIGQCFAPSVRLCFGESPVASFKAIKNEREIAATRNAHIRDGAAMVSFICWLKSCIGRETITEISAAGHLEQCRRKQGAYDLSFETIAGYEAHGAIIHYAATEETDVELKPEGFLLVDSGGQYEVGTTDITRTIALGSVSRHRKQHYTAVLKGHIALALAEFNDDTTGIQLDALARKPLQDMGLDYNHGTGHGVGHMLSVHEGPNTISKRGMESHILPGMITSDEPGVYLENQYGIRIENELLCIEADEEPYGASAKDGKTYAFETITLCPYEREAIDAELLTKEELDYVNDYHRKVYETLAPLLEPEEKKWLEEQCREISSTPASGEAGRSKE